MRDELVDVRRRGDDHVGRPRCRAEGADECGPLRVRQALEIRYVPAFGVAASDGDPDPSGPALWPRLGCRREIQHVESIDRAAPAAMQLLRKLTLPRSRPAAQEDRIVRSCERMQDAAHGLGRNTRPQQTERMAFEIPVGRQHRLPRLGDRRRVHLGQHASERQQRPCRYTSARSHSAEFAVAARARTARRPPTA